MANSRAESYLVNDIIRALYPHARLERHNVGKFYTADGRPIYAGPPKGYPDLSGNRRGDGRAVYIEAKIRPNKPTPEQLRYLADRRDEGAIAGVCYSVTDALALIGAADPEGKTEENAENTEKTEEIK